jgi:hypothetical protein
MKPTNPGMEYSKRLRNICNNQTLAREGEQHSETMRDRNKGMRDSAGKFFSTTQDASKIQSRRAGEMEI